MKSSSGHCLTPLGMASNWEQGGGVGGGGGSGGLGGGGGGTDTLDL